MRILVDVSAASYQRAGIGRYTRNLVAQLASYADVGLSYFLYGKPTAAPNLPEPLWSMALGHGHRRYRLMLLLHYYLGGKLKPQGTADLFHATDFVGPRFLGLPAVVTVHDLSFLVHPEWHAPLNALALRLLVPRAVREAAKVIAVSRWVASQLTSLLKVPADKVAVVHEGFDGKGLQPPIDWQPRLKALGLEAGYLLSVGTWEPRKNYLTLLQAYSRVCRELHEVPPLVICGNPGWRYRNFLAAVRRHPFGSNIRLVAGADDATLASLYMGARLFILASLDEGFGLPLLEAMAFGVPATVSRAGSLPEVGGEAVLYFDPLDPADMARTMKSALQDRDLREVMKQKGLARCQAFTWQNAANSTVEIYREALS